MRSALDAAKEGAGTWQFFEQDGVIDLDQNGSTSTLAVHTPSSRKSDEDGRFAVSLFRVSEAAGVDEDRAEHLTNGEAEIKKPLAWLQRMHPDFWRLSDFSTSMMLLRYLKSEQIQLLSFSPDDFDQQRPTPEWIYGSKVQPVVKPNSLAFLKNLSCRFLTLQKRIRHCWRISLHSSLSKSVGAFCL